MSTITSCLHMTNRLECPHCNPRIYTQAELDAALQSATERKIPCAAHFHDDCKFCLSTQAFYETAIEKLDAATERMAPSPCGVEGHVMLNWVGGVHTPHAGDMDHRYQADCLSGFCRLCAAISVSYQRGVSDGIESVARDK